MGSLCSNNAVHVRYMGDKKEDTQNLPIPYCNQHPHNRAP